MSIEHVNGHITLPNGKTLPCIDFDVDFTEVLPPVTEKQRRISETIKAMQSKRIVFHESFSGRRYGEYNPTGLVVDSTLAGESGEGQ